MTTNQNPDYIRVQTAIAKKLAAWMLCTDNETIEKHWDRATPEERQVFLNQAEEVLKVEGVEVRAEDQLPPDMVYSHEQHRGISKATQSKMRSSGFVRVVGKREG